MADPVPVDKVVQVDYRKLKLVCAYCSDKSVVIRVALTKMGDVRVSTLCMKHCEGEKLHCIEEGMTMAGRSSVAGVATDATFVDLSVLHETMEQVRAASPEDLAALAKEAGISPGEDTLHPKLQKFVDAVKADYLDPEYPREMLVREVTDLRARVVALEADDADDGLGHLVCKKHEVEGCEECWTAEELGENYYDG